MKPYRTTLDTGFSLDRFTLKPKKNVRIYEETRDNHNPNMVRVTSEGEFPVPTCLYLVFEVPCHLISKEDLNDLTKPLHQWLSGTVVKKDSFYEMTVYHRQAFHSGFVSQLARLGLIHLTWFTESDDGEKGYVNAKGWKMLYNLYSLSFYTLKKALTKEKNVENKRKPDSP
ncbi:hypothetical protein ACFYKX_10910 [Cytobacillus sp. FJAT-54145]|uniref:Uncharacterized protein n=1 Tax=Cytobacillus spartinae TaxID=3299023 RepID=A0ABW6KCW7_9BACI